MEARTATVVLAAGRVAIGAAAFAAPKLVSRGWLGDAVDLPGTRIAVRAFAVRDLALGLGTLATLDDPERSRNWVEAGIISDTGDFIATSIGRGAGSRLSSLGVLAIAAGAAGAGLWIRDQLTAQID